MYIIGAGMAGLIAGHILRKYNPTIIERSPYLVTNHHAVLRFKTDRISQITGIPFRKAWVDKGVWDAAIQSGYNQHPGLADNNAYSLKVSGRIERRSIMNLTPGWRYIAPAGFIEQLADGLKIDFDRTVDLNFIHHTCGPNTQIISTIPLPQLLGILDIEPQCEFPSKPIQVAKVKLNVKSTVVQTIYFPGSEPFYRATLTGSQLVIESTENLAFKTTKPYFVDSALAAFGLQGKKYASPTYDSPIYGSLTYGSLTYGSPTYFSMPYGKLSPASDDAARKAHITHLTERHNIYSLGRFATWRPLLLDDIVDDARVIDRLINMHSYDRKLVAQKGE